MQLTLDLRHDSIEEDFIFSESDYEHFVHTTFQDKEYSYKTKTEETLDKLKEKATDEHYFASLSNEYDALVAQLATNKGDDLFTNKQEIKEILTGEIRSRYFYQRGRIEAALNFDLELEKATEVLRNKEEYNRILANE